MTGWTEICGREVAEAKEQWTFLETGFALVWADTFLLEEGVEEEMESNTRMKICLTRLVRDRAAQVLPTWIYHKEGKAKIKLVKIFRIQTSLMIENVTFTTYFNIAKLLFLKKSQWSVDFLYSERSYDRNRNFYCTFLYIETMSYCKIQTDFFFWQPSPFLW